jgi:hypothetical protein
VAVKGRVLCKVLCGKELRLDDKTCACVSLFFSLISRETEIQDFASGERESTATFEVWSMTTASNIFNSWAHVPVRGWASLLYPAGVLPVHARAMCTVERQKLQNELIEHAEQKGFGNFRAMQN